MAGKGAGYDGKPVSACKPAKTELKEERHLALAYFRGCHSVPTFKAAVDFVVLAVQASVFSLRLSRLISCKQKLSGVAGASSSSARHVEPVM